MRSADDNGIAPAFATRWQAVAFIVLITFLLSLPVLLSFSGLLARRHTYGTLSKNAGDAAYIQQQIYDDPSDIDILILGTSVLHQAIDALHIDRQLKQSVGADVSVRMFGTHWRGEDLNYRILRDVLEQKNVRMLIVSMPREFEIANQPHSQSYRWFRYGDADLSPQVHWRNRLAMYGLNVLGAPRHLLSLIRHDLTNPSVHAADLGSAKIWRHDGRHAFVRKTLSPPTVSADDLIYSDRTRHRFSFDGKPLNAWQKHHIDRLGALARQNGIYVAVVNIPLSQERNSRVVRERLDWTEVLGGRTDLIGVPPATLFQHISDDEISDLFHTRQTHLNVNGNELFTRTITPAIISLYNKHVLPRR